MPCRSTSDKLDRRDDVSGSSMQRAVRQSEDASEATCLLPATADAPGAAGYVGAPHPSRDMERLLRCVASGAVWPLLLLLPMQSAAQQVEHPCPESARHELSRDGVRTLGPYDDSWDKEVRRGLGSDPPALGAFGSSRRDTRVIDSLWRRDSARVAWHLAEITASSRAGMWEAWAAAWHYSRLKIGVSPMLQAVVTAPEIERRLLGLQVIDTLAEASQRRAVRAMACDAAAQLAGVALAGRMGSLPSHWLIYQQGILEQARRLLTEEDRTFAHCLVATIDSMLAAGRDHRAADLRRFASGTIKNWETCR